MEEHFFLLPPCAVVATTVAFQEKGNFSWPFLGLHIYVKIPIASIAPEKTALPWQAPFAAFVVTITYRNLSALGAAGRTFYSVFSTVFFDVPLLLLAAGVGFLLLVFDDENVLLFEIRRVQDNPSQR